MTSRKAEAPSSPLRRATRPKDRKAQILASSARLFRERGYHGVGIDDIGAAVGVTGPAIYRHFSSKDAILVAIISDLLDSVLQRTDDLDIEPTDPLEPLRSFVEQVVDVAVGNRDFTTVSWREFRSIPDEQLRLLGASRALVADRWFHAMRAALPERSGTELHLRMRAANGALSSLAFYSASPPRSQLSARLTDILMAVLCAPTEIAAERVDRGERARPSPSAYGRLSRREAILDAAARLFSTRGYGAVGVDEIGEMAGISGPAIYRHFSSKEELLTAAFRRAGEWIAANTSAALVSAASPAEALDNLVAAYVVAAYQHRDLIALHVSGGGSLPNRQAHNIRRAQRAYVDEWIHALAAARPELDETATHITTHAAIGLINDLCIDRPRLSTVRPSGPQDVVRLAVAALRA